MAILYQVLFLIWTASNIGEAPYLGLARQILVDKPGYSQQLDDYTENHSTRAVTKRLEARLLQSVSPRTA